MIFMVITMGLAFLAGFVVMLCIFFINMQISKVVSRYELSLSEATDSRMQLTRSTFNNIKFIKINAWEEYFYDKLMGKRVTEV